MADSLEVIASEVVICNLCRLSQSRTNAVPGEGSNKAKLLFVGEAPGRKEDKLGRPFVGSAGKILDSCLAKAGINRFDIFITNIVKCRPPNNRPPQEDERLTCLGYLQRQIDILKPSIVCLLGATSYSSLLGGKSIMSNRGKFVTKNGITYFITIHPAAAIYNKELIKLLEQDLKIVATRIAND